jgi:hypothetical protein
MGDTHRLSQLRDRLGSLSWFMSYLNEPLARQANREDGCKGRFWEGRFKSQRLLDETAILACMVYVDLNPVRAGIANDVELANHTSLAHRLSRDAEKKPSMMSINNSDTELPFSMSLQGYISLCRWTIRAQQPKKPARIDGLPPPELWIQQYLPKPGCWQRALGSVQAIKDYANDIGQCWIVTRSV